jgi:hypothetical protein
MTFKLIISFFLFFLFSSCHLLVDIDNSIIDGMFDGKFITEGISNTYEFKFVVKSNGTEISCIRWVMGLGGTMSQEKGWMITDNSFEISNPPLFKGKVSGKFISSTEAEGNYDLEDDYGRTRKGNWTAKWVSSTDSLCFKF